MRYRHWHLQTQTRGSRLGSLYYSITNLTRDLPAALACNVIKVTVRPVVCVYYPFVVVFVVYYDTKRCACQWARCNTTMYGVFYKARSVWCVMWA